MAAFDPTASAAGIIAARAERKRLRPFSETFGDFSRADANLVSAELDRMRRATGERPVGRKIGFTNRNIWDEYGVHAPIWGNVYDTTLIEAAGGDKIAIGHLSQPRIEPEIVLGLDRDIGAGATREEAEQAVAWVAHGYEIVHTVFADWKFAVADTVAEGGLHGLLVIGPRRHLAQAERAGLAARLAAIKIELACDGAPMDRGTGANVLDGPVDALAFAAREIAAEGSTTMKSGELVSTGTVTRAFPIASGQRWSTSISGYDLPGMDVIFA